MLRPLKYYLNLGSVRKRIIIMNLNFELEIQIVNIIKI